MRAVARAHTALAAIAFLTCAPAGVISTAPAPARITAQLGTSSAYLPPLGVSPGFLDTLIAIAGAPRGIGVASMPDTLLAEYHPHTDSILVSTVVPASPRRAPAAQADKKARISPDWVISHEFGHRYDYLRRHKPCRRRDERTARAEAENFYANRNSQEGFAEAFANAIDYLRYTAAIGEHDTEALLQREWFVPGTFDLVRELLRHRVYARHPLRARPNRRQ